MENSDRSNHRRSFLKTIVSLTAGAAIFSVAKKSHPDPKDKKIKMLTAEGRLVEVNESALSQAAPEEKRATNQEVLEWMNQSKQ